MNNLFLFFNNFSHQTDFIDFLIKFVAVYLPYLVVLGAGIFLLVHNHIIPSKNPFLEFSHKWRIIFFAFISGGLGWVVAEILKRAIAHPRPFELLSGVQNLFPESGFSFPSQHATFFTALAFSIYLTHKKAGYFFLFLAFFISIARVMGGVHYPIDIIGGILLGIIVAYLVHRTGFANPKNRV